MSDVNVKETQYTPGPWQVGLTGRRGTFYIPQIASHEVVAAETDGVDGYSVTKPNQSLIAAAPEMYEALKAIAPIIERDNHDPEGVNWSKQLPLIRAAIAKAEAR